MNIEQLIILKSIAKVSTDKRELSLISKRMQSVRLIQNDLRFNLTMDIRSILINKL